MERFCYRWDEPTGRAESKAANDTSPWSVVDPLKNPPLRLLELRSRRLFWPARGRLSPNRAGGLWRWKRLECARTVRSKCIWKSVMNLANRSFISPWSIRRISIHSAEARGLMVGSGDVLPLGESLSGTRFATTMLLVFVWSFCPCFPYFEDFLVGAPRPFGNDRSCWSSS